MTGTLLNMLTVGIGGTLGLLAGRRLSAKFQTAVMNVLGLFTAVLGVGMALKTSNPLVLLASLLAGTALGEWIDLDRRLEQLGVFLQRRFGAVNFKPSPEEKSTPERGSSLSLRVVPNQEPVPAEETAPEEQPVPNPGPGLDAPPAQMSSRFVAGFVGASLLFCVGPMSIMGAIQDGLTGDYSTLAIKAVMDGFAAIVLASSLGVGVLFSVFTILVYQGSITMAAGLVQGILTPAMVSELTAAGGILIFAIGLGLLEIKRVKVANMLPAIFFAPFVYRLFGLFK
ncbi:MAG: DUF554 family protein [Firmicutes bacterium]|nr:DUF554 family protein [Candidatus Fermentithermobacillaceae bacterium]